MLLGLIAGDATGQSSWGVVTGGVQSSVVRDRIWDSPSADAPTLLYPSQLGESNRSPFGGIFLRSGYDRRLSYYGSVQLLRKGLHNPFERLDATADYISTSQALEVRVASWLSAGVGFEAASLRASDNWGELSPASLDFGLYGNLILATPINGLSAKVDFSGGVKQVFSLNYPTPNYPDGEEYFNEVVGVSLLYDPWKRRRDRRRPYKGKIPLLEWDSYRFIDHNSNGVINANEEVQLKLTVRNAGNGVATKVVAHVDLEGQSKGLKIKRKKIKLGRDLMPGATENVFVDVASGGNLSDGEVDIVVDIRGRAGLSVNGGAYTHRVETRKSAPFIQVVDDIDFHDVWRRSRHYSEKIVIKNTGNSAWEKGKVRLKIDCKCYLDAEAKKGVSIDRLEPDESMQFEFTVSINPECQKSAVGVQLVFEGLSKTEFLPWSVNQPIRTSAGIVIREPNNEEWRPSIPIAAGDVRCSINGELAEVKKIQVVHVRIDESQNCAKDPDALEADMNGMIQAMISAILGYATFDLVTSDTDKILEQWRKEMSGIYSPDGNSNDWGGLKTPQGYLTLSCFCQNSFDYWAVRLTSYSTGQILLESSGRVEDIEPLIKAIHERVR